MNTNRAKTYEIIPKIITVADADGLKSTTMAGMTIIIDSNDWDALKPFIHILAETLSVNMAPTVE